MGERETGVGYNWGMVSAKTYEELDEVRAPGDLPEAEVGVGDRGVVLEVFPGRPAENVPPALLVEYADSEGQTKALVTYSTDLRQIFGVDPESN